MKQNMSRDQKCANTIGSKIKPLNFSTESFSKEELEKVVKQTKSAESTCGLCKIAIGAG